jgi:hypothetical protein
MIFKITIDYYHLRRATFVCRNICDSRPLKPNEIFACHKMVAAHGNKMNALFGVMSTVAIKYVSLYLI